MEKNKGNLILGWIGIAVILIGAYYFFNWLLKVISIIKTCDAVIRVAIITGFVTIVTTFVKTIIDIKQSRLQYLTQKRETAYYQFIDMVYKINQSSKNSKSYPTEEQIKDIMKFSKEITLWGSKNVVEKWTELRRVGNISADGKQLLKISEQLMNEMRKDLGVPKVKENSLLAFFINDIENLK